MIIQQIIDEQMKEFDKSIFHGPDFLNNFARKLIEAMGEEIISEGERIYDNGAYGDEACEGDECHFESGYLVARDVLEGQQLKLKEIINSLKEILSNIK